MASSLSESLLLLRSTTLLRVVRREIFIGASATAPQMSRRKRSAWPLITIGTIATGHFLHGTVDSLNPSAAMGASILV